MAHSNNNPEIPRVTPEGTLLHLEIKDLQPSSNNPRQLFDSEPLVALKESIRQHGVLVPLTVYSLPGQEKYGIVDGERRYRCCIELSKDDPSIKIPANVVAAPDPMASLIYMFNIHQFRQQWELMPTAIALKSIMDELGTDDDGDLIELTGLSERQVERCKTILQFPSRYRQMSMNVDPKERIPSNFWVELFPVLQLSERLVPDLIDEKGRDGIIDCMVKKYHDKKIKSVIHFRRILEAHEVQKDGEGGVEAIADKLREYILEPNLETRAAFDSFISDNRKVKRAVDAANKFILEIKRAKIEHETDKKNELIAKLTDVLCLVQNLLATLEGEDPPDEEDT